MENIKINLRSYFFICLLSLAVVACGGGSSTDSDPGPDPDPDPDPTGETFDSGTLSPGGSYSYTFDSEGSTDYICTLHPDMTGNVTVEEGAEISEETTVTIDDFSFMPQNITVAPGTEVTWVNEDDVNHTATSD